MIGRGKFGTVYKARHISDGQIYAIKQLPIKMIESNNLLYKLLLTEVTIMKEINHPNILHLFDFYKSKTNYYIVMNYCN